VIASGEALLAPEITRRLIARFVSGGRPNAPPPELEKLTVREREVLAQVARGRSNAEIASALYISGGTAKTHVARILSKLELRDRSKRWFSPTSAALFSLATLPIQGAGQHNPHRVTESARAPTVWTRTYL
jgi:DNA-binding NarL/FixJ family response regulator